jgi:hypothetical protein
VPWQETADASAASGTDALGDGQLAQAGEELRLLTSLGDG